MFTRGYIPLKPPFCWLNPIQPPLNHHFPMVFLWFSYGFPMVFLWFSYGFPMVFLWFSYGFPMVFLWFSYGFPMVFLWFSKKFNAFNAFFYPLLGQGVGTVHHLLRLERLGNLHQSLLSLTRWPMAAMTQEALNWRHLPYMGKPWLIMVKTMVNNGVNHFWKTIFCPP